MTILKKRKGSLVQTLVLCIILALISAMILKWVMGRYLLSVRLYKSAQAKVRSEGIFNDRISNWNFNLPNNGSQNFNVDGKIINVNVSGTQVTMSTDEDQ